jgi:hypothetical protein
MGGVARSGNTAHCLLQLGIAQQTMDGFKPERASQAIPTPFSF